MKILLIFSVFFQILISNDRPKWIDEIPAGYKNNYFVGQASSRQSELMAREKALFSAIAAVIRDAKMNAQVNQSSQIRQKEEMKNGESVNFEEVTKITSEVVIKGESQTIMGLKEEEHFTEYSNGEYTVFTLVKIPKPFSMQTEPPSKSEYVTRSFIPGWSQYYKGQSTKGFLFISGEAALITSGIVFAFLKTDAENQISPFYAQAVNDDYQTQANTFNTISTISFIGAGVLYVYNIIDGISSEEKVYVNNVTIKPAIFTLNRQNGLGINIGISF